MKKNMNAPSFTRNHTSPIHGGPGLAQPFVPNMSPGPCQPPRNSVIAIALITSMFMYSPRKNSAHFMDEYSVWKPATSSPSASGRSNGARFVSANAVITKITNGSTRYQWKMPQFGSARGVKGMEYHPPWRSTIPTSDIVPAYSSTGMVEIPMASSYEIICADERSPPSSAYLLFEAQPPSVIAYTPRLDMARNSSSPTLMSVTTNVGGGPIGMTENVTMAGNTARIGARWKMTLFAFAGMNSSLNRSFRTSAMGWRSPSGPTRLGPVRAWMWPQIFRSA